MALEIPLLGTIYDLAALAVTKFGLQGIDWTTLASQGRSSVWDRDYITQYMVPAQARMNAAIAGIDLDFGGDPQNLQQSYSISYDLLNGLANTVLPLFNLPDPALVTTEVQISREAIRYLIAHASAAANYGLLVHSDETIQHSGMSDADIATHANTVVGTMNALTMLDSLKFYDALDLRDTSASTSGLGIAPLVAVLIAVVAIAALALVAWVIVSLVDLTKKNAIVAQTCQAATASGDAAVTQQCIATLTDPSKNAGTQIPTMLKQILMGLVPYALGGVAIYALYLAAPYLIKNLLSPKTAAA